MSKTSIKKIEGVSNDLQDMLFKIINVKYAKDTVFLRMNTVQSLAQEPQPVYYSLIRFSLG